MLERVDHLTAPPVVGRYYLVPTVTHQWCVGSKARAWPVFNNRHSDAQFLHFPDEHYHVDPRFIDDRTWKQLDDDWSGRGAEGVTQSKPLARRREPGAADPPLAVWRRRKCVRELGYYDFHGESGVREIKKAFAGHQCASSKAGWICPHQNFPLGGAPVRNGVITCPLHGLYIDAASGKVLPANGIAKERTK